MDTVLVSALQLAFVALVYSTAYRQGAEASRRRAEVFVEEFSYPMAELLAKLEQEIEKDAASTPADPQSPPEE